MNWYLTKLVFQIISGEGLHTPQFEEQLRLIEAACLQQAFQKAECLGRNEEDAFYNQDRELVRWTFINIAELKQISGFSDGAEIHSRILEADNADIYIALTHGKAELIRGKSARHFIET